MGSGVVDTIDVLHVDDDAEFVAMAAEFLEREDDRLSVDTVTDPDAGSEALAEGDYDCVVSDYEMPGLDGLEFLRAVREREPGLPFVLYTGKGSEEVASEAISTGVTDYLQKEAGTSQYAVLANRIRNAVEQHRSRRAVERTERKLSELAERTDDVLFMFDGEWSELLFVNAAYEDVYGGTVAELEADPSSFLNYVHPEDRERAVGSMERIADGEADEVTYRVCPAEDEVRWIWGRAEPVIEDGEVARVVGFARDITEHRAHRRKLEQIRRHVTDVVWMSDPDTNATEFVSDAYEDIWGRPPESLHEDPSSFVEAIHPEDRDRVRAAIARRQRDPEAYDERFRVVRPDGEVRWVRDRAAGVFQNGSLTSIVGVATDITERMRHERTLEELHDATRRLMGATAAEEVATVGSETAERVLNLPYNGVHLRDPETGVLSPVAWTDSTEEVLGGDPPDLPLEGSLAGKVYRTSEAAVYRDLDQAEERFAADTPFRSEVVLPLGEHGVFLASSTDTDAFDETDETLARVLAANLETTLDRVERERRLEEQNERLREFASIVSHDLRSPLNVAQGRLELARDGDGGEHLEDAAHAVDRSLSLVEDLLAVVRSGDRDVSLEAVDLAAVAEASWRTVETDGADLRAETDRTVRADPGRLEQLLSNLFRNAVEHGDGTPLVRVGDLPEGFYVADDGPGIPPAERQTVFGTGHSTGEGGSGLGLTIVEQVATDHGWEVDLTESRDGGARFELRGVRTEG